jgi:type III restriction enzyme
VQDKVDVSHVNPEFLEDVHTLKLPKFYLKTLPSLLDPEGKTELDKAQLLLDFSLKGKRSFLCKGK